MNSVISLLSCDDQKLVYQCVVDGIAVAHYRAYIASQNIHVVLTEVIDEDADDNDRVWWVQDEITRQVCEHIRNHYPGRAITM